MGRDRVAVETLHASQCDYPTHVVFSKEGPFVRWPVVPP